MIRSAGPPSVIDGHFLTREGTWGGSAEFSPLCRNAASLRLAASRVSLSLRVSAGDVCDSSPPATAKPMGTAQVHAQRQEERHAVEPRQRRVSTQRFLWRTACCRLRCRPSLLPTRAAATTHRSSLHHPPTSSMYLQRLGPLTRYDANARCNDGSPAPFFFRAGQDTSLWLLYLEGNEGGVCGLLLRLPFLQVANGALTRPPVCVAHAPAGTSLQL